MIIWKSGRDIGLLQSLIQQDRSLVYRLSSAFCFPISISRTKAILFTNGTTDPPNPLTIFSREIPFCKSVTLLGLLMDSKMQWHEHINSLKSLTIYRLCILKRLAGSKWGCHPKIILDFHKLYIHSNIEYGIQIFSACPPFSFKILESSQNSAIQMALGVHKHTPLSKLKILSGLGSLSKRACSLRIKYFSQIQAYGAKHAVYAHAFAGKSACPNAHSSWNQFQLEVPN